MRESIDCFQLQLETTTLSNGLRVCLHPDPTLPITALEVVYHVGSKDESPELTGLAHLFEHLMFEGSAGFDDDFFKPLQQAGAMVNGSTSRDITSYYEVVPSNFIERAIWLEADRMGRLLDVLTEGKLENQRSVVKNERLQRVDNQPYGRVHEETSALLYPENHPYHWPVIGWMDHLDKITLADVKAFFRRFYTPSQASIVVSGSMDRDRVMGWLERSFGSIPAGERIPCPTVHQEPIHGEYRRAWDEPLALGRLDMNWPTVPRFAPEEAALDLASLILGDGKDSRLRRRLEREEKLVHSVDAYHSTYRLAGNFGVYAFALPEVPLGRIESIVREVLAEFLKVPPTDDELTRAQRWFANRAYSRVETVLGKADLLQHYIFHRGRVDGGMLADEIERYHQISAEDVQAAAAKYLTDAMVVTWVQPAAQATKAPLTLKPAEPGEKFRRGGDINNLPGPSAAETFHLPRPSRSKVDHLTLLTTSTAKLPRVTMQLIVEAGSAQDPAAQLGLSRLVTDTMDEGTLTSDALEIARRLESLGATLSISGGIEAASVTLRSLRSTLPEAMQIFADVLSAPAFREEDVDRERQRLLAELAHRRRQPDSLADDAIDEELFGATHPYGRAMEGLPEHLSAISRDDVRRFHERHYRASGNTLIAVGDIEPDTFQGLVEEHLADWIGHGSAPSSAVIEEITPSPATVRIIPRASSSQSVLRIGRLATQRKTPDYEALVLLNTIIGGQFSSRLNAKLREEKGFTYGVHSSFAFRRIAGSFLVGTDVESRVTLEAVRDILDVMTSPIRDQPITQQELDNAKSYITRRFPNRFETQSGILSQWAHRVIFRLEDEDAEEYLAKINSVTIGDMERVAAQYLDPSGLKVVIVGRADDADGVTDAVCQALDCSANDVLTKVDDPTE